MSEAPPRQDASVGSALVAGSALQPAPPFVRGRLSFLTARWQHLCLFNYPVEPDRLTPLLPPGLSLDIRDGSAWLSLVAFDFLDTRVLGVGWPWHRCFPEINLRFYVREGDTRGVCFVREYVPRRLIAWIARALYNEPYVHAPMASQVQAQGDQLSVAHQLKLPSGTQRLQVRADLQALADAEDSTAHFFKEHSWGYGQTRAGNLLRYEVRHTIWETHRVRSHSLDWDWGAAYGPDWRFLDACTPASVFLAAGSTVRVSPWLSPAPAGLSP